jgi:hypothetical protein
MFIISSAVSLSLTYLGDVDLQAAEQRDPADSTKADSSKNKAKAEEDPYFDILNVIKNFFLRRFDTDKTQSLSSISKSYQVRLPEGRILDYNGLRSGLEERSQRMSLLALDEFKITELEVNGDFAKARIEFLQRVKNRQNGHVRQKKHTGIVFLKREEGWKITGIVDLLRINAPKDIK